MTTTRPFAALLCLSLLGGCASHLDPALAKEHQAQLQRTQSRLFDTNDSKLIIRSTLSALQDFGFIIDKVEPELGTVTAAKFGKYPMSMTITVKTVSKTQTLVRGDAQYNSETIEDPAVYQQFFDALQKSLALAAHPAK